MMEVVWTCEDDPETIGMKGVVEEVCDDGMYHITWEDGVSDYWYDDVFEFVNTHNES